MMPEELSCNWKRLQAQLQAEGASSQPKKRKLVERISRPAKKYKVQPTAVLSGTANNRRKARGNQTSTMGGAQSKLNEHGSKHALSPSLATWGEENDISAETLAEAYGLELKGNSFTSAARSDMINNGLTKDLEIGKYVSMDCEMVGVGEAGRESVLARASIVDFHGRQVYDSYVKPRERVTDWRTAVSGISPREMRLARSFETVQQEVANILEGRILVGHDIKYDLDVLRLNHPSRDTRDTSNYPGFRTYGAKGKPALKMLAMRVLGLDIQRGPHSSLEDARATMLLFRKHKTSFDLEHASRYVKITVGNPLKGKRVGDEKKRSEKKGNKKKAR